MTLSVNFFLIGDSSGYLARKIKSCSRRNLRSSCPPLVLEAMRASMSAEASVKTFSTGRPFLILMSASHKGKKGSGVGSRKLSGYT